MLHFNNEELYIYLVTMKWNHYIHVWSNIIYQQGALIESLYEVIISLQYNIKLLIRGFGKQTKLPSSL